MRKFAKLRLGTKRPFLQAAKVDLSRLKKGPLRTQPELGKFPHLRSGELRLMAEDVPLPLSSRRMHWGAADSSHSIAYSRVVVPADESVDPLVPIMPLMWCTKCGVYRHLRQSQAFAAPCTQVARSRGHLRRLQRGVHPLRRRWALEVHEEATAIARAPLAPPPGDA